MLALAFLLGACKPATPDPEQIMSVVNTAVALTMTAQSPTQPAATATQPPQPTATSIPPTPQPTATLIPPTVGVNTGGSGSGSAYSPPPPKCILLGQQPEDGAKLRPNTDFDAVWTLKNNSTVTWPQNSDIALVSGPAIAKQTIYHLQQDVPPGGEITIIVDMVAPRETGFYVSQWEIRADSVYCRPYIAFYVENP